MKQEIGVLGAGRRGPSGVRKLLNHEPVPAFHRDDMIPNVLEKPNA